jgi:FkbM family methyltransferase
MPLASDESLTEQELLFKVSHNGQDYPLWMPNELGSEFVFHEVFQRGCYRPVALKEYVPQVIMDVGGFVGDTALYFHLCFPSATVHVYEPTKRSIYYMNKNVKNFPQIQIHPYGLSNTTHETEMFLGAGSALNSIQKNIGSSETKEKICLRSIQEELETIEGEISILKVDIEGNEPMILSEFLKYAKNEIPMIYFEYHSEEDRLKLDEILKEKYILSNGSVVNTGCGTMLYLLKTFKDPGFVPALPIILK